MAELANRAGATVRIDSVAELDVTTRVIRLRGGETVAFDLLSLDVGSIVAGATVPGVVEHACAMKPFSPKAGMYAVRMAPVLATNVISAALGQSPTLTYTPQRHALAPLSTGDGRALLSWRGIALESRWAQRLKGLIDTRYVERYRAIVR